METKSKYEIVRVLRYIRIQTNMEIVVYEAFKEVPFSSIKEHLAILVINNNRTSSEVYIPFENWEEFLTQDPKDLEPGEKTSLEEIISEPY